MENFEKELEILINKHSKENDSNTPDFILAEYLNNCLKTFNDALQKRAHWYGETGLPIDEKFIYKKPKMSFEDEAIMLENAASNHNFNNYCARATLGVCPPITPYNLLDMRTYTASERRAIKAVLESRNACCDVSRNAYDNWEIIMVMTNGCPCGHNGKTLPANSTIKQVRVGDKLHQVGQRVRNDGVIVKFTFTECGRVKATIRYVANCPFKSYFKSFDIVNL